MSAHHSLYQMFLTFEIFVYRYCWFIPFHHSSYDFNISPQSGFPLLSQQKESFLKYLLCVFKKKSIIWCQFKSCVYSVNSKISTESREYVQSKYYGNLILLQQWHCMKILICNGFGGQWESDVLVYHIVGVHAQSCTILCDSTDCSLPGSSVHGISQARILQWVVISSSRGSSWLRDFEPSALAGVFFTTVAPGSHWCTALLILMLLRALIGMWICSFIFNFSPF